MIQVQVTLSRDASFDRGIGLLPIGGPVQIYCIGSAR
jgi:hypothetical protein